MKKLVCADEIRAAADKGQKVFYVEGHTIVTPAARDLAKELGVQIAAGTTSAGISTGPDGGSSCQGNLQRDIDPNLILQIVKGVLANHLLTNSAPVAAPPFITEGDPKSGLKIVRGRTVKYEPFDTGDPSTKVAYREVVSKEDSQMSAGFLTIEKSSFDWELTYEEIDIVLEGTLSITINGETYHAHQGDVLFVPKGSKVTWSSPDYVKLFYATYPANWADLMA